MRTTVSAQTVETLTQHDKNATVGALAAAFYADPVFEWLYPDAVNRRTVIGPFFEIFIDAIAPYGVSHLAGDGRGATLWVPPGESVVEEEEAGAFFDDINALSPADGERLGAMLRADGRRPSRRALLVPQLHRRRAGSAGHRCRVCVAPGCVGSQRPRRHSRVPRGHEREQLPPLRAFRLRGDR